jgi:hypothetical protein
MEVSNEKIVASSNAVLHFDGINGMQLAPLPQ